MTYTVSEKEKQALKRLRSGVSSVSIFQAGLYPTAVVFYFSDDSFVNLCARDVYVAPRFEVFPITVSDREITCEPDQVLDSDYFGEIIAVHVLSKTEWIVPSTEEDKAQMLGEASHANTQYEGRLTDVPPQATGVVTLDAGIEIQGASGKKFVVATSIFPFSLYVSDCSFSEPFDESMFDRKLVFSKVEF